MAEDNRLRFPRATAPYPSGSDRSGRPSASDPLVELARLIGQDGGAESRRDAAQFDVRAPMPMSEQLEAATRQLSRSLASRDLRTPTREAPAEPKRTSLATAQANALRTPQYPSAAARVSPSEPAAPEPTAYPTADAVHYGHDAHYADSQAPYPPEATYSEQHSEESLSDQDYDTADDVGPLQKERGRGRLALIAGAAALVAVGTVGAFGYRALVGDGGNAPPVIKADAGPAKIVPAPAKGDSSTNRAVYDRSEKAQIERIVTREEQPLEMKDAKPAVPRSGAPAAAPISNSPLSAAAPLTPPATAINSGEPKKVRTVAIRPDGSVAPESTRSLPVGDPSRAPSGTAVNPRNPLVRPPASVPAAGAPVALTPQAESPRSTGTAAPVTPPSRVAALGTHVVQLTSQKSEAEAQASFRALQGRYPAVLGSLQPLIRRVDLGERGTYYRAQVGPFSSIEQANEMCLNLKAAGGQCIVQRN